jgi:CRISPR/Cas system-associated exonuclease Cas4 (RecB family)
MKDSLYVINLKGEKEPFSFQKVYRSARRAGASPILAKDITATIKKEAYPGIKTSEIFKKIKQFLARENPQSAIKFSLKDAMRKLGPTGFPFEKFIREVLLSNGFEVKINQYISGSCPVTYEIDFLAKKNKLIYIGECKYHPLPGEKVDLQVALANYARFLDIKENSYFKKLQSDNFQIKPMLITNTKFTTQAIRYSKCKGIELLGWRYPENEGLEYLIEKEKLYPVTILPSLKGYLKDIFAKSRMMLAKDLLRMSPDLLAKKLSIPKKTLLPLVNQARVLLK